MPKKTIIVAALAAVGTIAYWFSFLGSEVALMERHPDIDPKIVVKVHRKLFRDVLFGRMPDHPDDYTDEELDVIFIERCNALTS